MAEPSIQCDSQHSFPLDLLDFRTGSLPCDIPGSDRTLDVRVTVHQYLAQNIDQY